MLRKLILTFIVATLAACPIKKPDLELEAAEKALNDARTSENDCVPADTLKTAEMMLSESKRLYEKQEYEGSRVRAQEAEKLAKQAKAAADACKAKKEAEAKARAEAEAAAKLKGASATDAATRSADLTSVEQTIYFDYNDASIREDSKAVLTKIAQMLVADSSLKLEVEGHCDDRGSTEYNLHLGERRARAVEKYLLTQGAKASQLLTISYGEERPIDLTPSEAGYAKNRRAEVKKAPN